MNYIPNPKLEGSGIVAAIPQASRGPMECGDCFFQSERSYLEPLEENLPNVPPGLQTDHVVRVNDGLDSCHDIENVKLMMNGFPVKFYNTTDKKSVKERCYNAPVVLTINPDKMTNKQFARLHIPPPELMFVRFQANTWNRALLKAAVEWYTIRKVPLVVTFMAYFDTMDKIPESHRHHYRERKCTADKYMAITFEAARMVMLPFQRHKLVYQCGQEDLTPLCKYCGNCLREYFATKERMGANDSIDR